MVNHATEVFTVADWVVDQSTSRISRHGDNVQLEPKVMDVLVYLAKHAGQVTSREELEAEVWHGRVVGYDAVTSAIVKLRRAFDDDPRHPQIIETLSKKGYRLTAQVTFPDELTDTAFVTSEAANQSDFKKLINKPGIVALATVFTVIFVTAIWIGVSKLSKNDVSVLSTAQPIAVLPFKNLSADHRLEYFVDGFTDDLITSLAQYPELQVIARDSSFFYKNENEAPSEIGKKLGVRFLLLGSIRRDDEQIRINTKLVDLESDTHLWAKQYDDLLANIFKIEQDVTQSVLTKLAVNFSTGAKQDLGRPRTGNPHAYDNFLLGRQLFYRFLSKDENRRSREYFQKAIEYDQDFAIAHAMLGWTHVFDVMNGWTDNREESLKLAIASANRAISIQPALPVAYFVTGLAYRQRGEYVKALVEVEKAVKYDPNYANAHVLHATLLYYAGRPHEGLERIQKAIKLNPHHPYNYIFHLGQAYYVLGRYQDATEAFKKGIKSNPSSERLHVWQAAAYAQLGNLKQADWEMIQVLSINPDFSLQNIKQSFPFKDPDDLEHFMQGLKKAGFE